MQIMCSILLLLTKHHSIPVFSPTQLEKRNGGFYCEWLSSHLSWHAPNFMALISRNSCTYSLLECCVIDRWMCHEDWSWPLEGERKNNSYMFVVVYIKTCIFQQTNNFITREWRMRSGCKVDSETITCIYVMLWGEVLFTSHSLLI